jgi:putative transposase
LYSGFLRGTHTTKIPRLSFSFVHYYRDKDMIVNYIINPKEHHKRKNFKEELEKFLLEFGIDYDPKYL